ncbi:hypothetical protein [Paenibacillus sp. GCM10027626]|uniref:hypothetical protein n=1 Tax=Paenibacillus sp. GCM10027626 TaxID=3273411 RepID=UPI00362548B7
MNKSSTRMMLVFVFIFALIVPSRTFALTNASSITDPPPGTEPFTVFDPDFKYLDNGNGYISDLGNGKVSIGGQTLGTRILDTIGVQVTLQRWTGSEWVNASIGSNVTNTDSSYTYSSREVSVSSGYYYRVANRHWITYGNTLEEGTVYTSSILIN